MTQIEKRFTRLLNNPKEIKWTELQTILKKCGLVCEPPSGGSHWTVYDETSETNITVPVHNNRVKAIYVKKLLALIKEIREEKKLMAKDLSSYQNLKYSVKLTPIAQEDGGGWLAEIPELKGCMSDGETQEEALTNVEEAKITWLTTALKRNQTIPLPNTEENETYSGKFTLRLPKFLHKELSLAAENDNISLKQYILSLVALNLGKNLKKANSTEVPKRKRPKSHSQ